MKIYISHPSDIDYKDSLYALLRNSSLNTEHEIFLPHESDQIINTKEVIESCDIVIAEVSHPSTGIGIELGWANSAGIPIVCIHQANVKLSRSLGEGTKTFLTYSSSEGLIHKIAGILR